MKRAMEIITKPKFIINKEAKMANNSQLAFIISQAMFIGEVYGLNKNKEDFNEKVWMDYARGMINIALRELYLNEESIAEKALIDFLSTNTRDY